MYKTCIHEEKQSVKQVIPEAHFLKSGTVDVG